MAPFQYRAFVLALCFLGVNSFAADFDFYGRFLSLADTNDWRAGGVTNALLVDVGNKSPKLTNSVISFQKLKSDGEVGNVRLGMTMEEVVRRFGKPMWLHAKCDGGHRFSFSDCSLVFVGNCLSKVRLPEDALFDQGISGGSNLNAWREVLGTPKLVNEDSYGSAVVYEFIGKVRTVLLLSFQPDGEVKFPPAIYLDPPITNWFKKSQL